MKTLHELKETLEYLECMQLKRCNPNTQEKISKEIFYVTFQIDEIEQLGYELGLKIDEIEQLSYEQAKIEMEINADENRFNRIKPLTPYQLFDFNQIGF